MDDLKVFRDELERALMALDRDTAQYGLGATVVQGIR